MLLCSTDKRGPDRAQKIGILNRLGQEIHGPCFHRPDAHGDVAMTGEENDWQKDAIVREPSLQVKAIQFRHGHIENQATV